MRRGARTAHARSCVSALLAIHSSSHSATLRRLRRSAAGLADAEPSVAQMPALSSHQPLRRPRSDGRRVRRGTPVDCSGVEVRGAPFAGAAACCAHGRARPGHAGRCRRRRARAPSPFEAARTWVQPGRRHRETPALADDLRSPADAGNRGTGRAASGTPARERTRGLRANTTRRTRERKGRHPRGRRQYDWRYA